MVGSPVEQLQDGNQKGPTSMVQQVADRSSSRAESQKSPEGSKHSAACSNELRRHHGPTCSASLIEISGKPKQHQPHCIHHNSNWHRQQRVIQANQHQRHSNQPEDAASDGSNYGNSKGLKARSHLAEAAAGHKQPADKSYLLVEYRQSSNQHPLYSQPSYRHHRHPRHHRNYHNHCAPIREASGNNGDNKERTTIKFISQLYFLLHLSIMLSLLLHHKSLVSNGYSRGLDGSTLHTRSVVRPYEPSATNGSTVIQLPVPQMLQANGTQQHRPSLINSVVVASTKLMHTNDSASRSNQTRFGRQTSGSSPPASSDILVRLVGHWHATCALHYYLCYLLASSVATLVFIRLARLFKSRQRRPVGSIPNGSTLFVHGFDQQTRLDCTPVLIGSVSLGLIQLIVIGLDIASIVERTSDSRCSTYLPMLQFAFVSLLMQFILGRVAKNHEQKKGIGVPTSLQQTTNLEARSAGALSINHSPMRANNGQKQQLTTTTTTTPDDLDNGASLGGWPANGGQNIALAHLLVTHILLWLMKLNSISLIHLTPPPPVTVLADHNQVATGINVGNLFNEDQSSSPSSVRVWQQQQQQQQQQQTTNLSNKLPPSNSFDLVETAEDGEQDNRAQLENILRRKIPTLLDHNKSSSINRPNITSQKADWNFQQVNSTTAAANVIPMVNVQTPPALFNLSTTSTAAATTTSNQSLATVKTNLPSIKNERDLGKLNELLPIKSPRGFVLNLNPNQTQEPPSSSVSMSQAQLMQLLSMAAKGALDQVRQKPSEWSVQPANLTSSPPVGANVFRSSLPKRMTAFRQTTRPLLGDPASSPRPVGAHSAANESRTSEAPKDKQKVARITVSRNEEPEVTTRAPLDDKVIEEPIRLAKSSVRPFPSVDHGEPLEHTYERRPAPEDVKSESHSKEAGRPLPPESAKSSEEQKLEEGEPPPVKDLSDRDSPSVTSEEPSNADDDSEADLDALLPPVPNYSETSDDDEAPAKMKRANNSENNEDPQRDPNINVDDDGLMFNEAASTWNITTVPANSSLNVNEKMVSEALTSPNRTASSGPSFADYLLPIVHQYHILIIAILFNMWLNGLRPRRPRRRMSDLKVASPHLDRFGLRHWPASWSGQHHWALYSSSSGSSDSSGASRNASSRGLIAIPIRGKTEPKWLEAEGAYKDPWAPSDAARHRSRSTDSLQRRLTEPDTGALSPQRGNSLSRSARRQAEAHGSGRSSSSERLLWIPSSKLRGPSHRKRRPQQNQMADSRSGASSHHSASTSLTAEQRGLAWRQPPGWPPSNPTRSDARDVSSSVCSLFFGLLVVSGALIVIVLGADLLLVVAQCLGQLLSILVCLLGLCLIWRLRARAAALNKSAARRLARLAGGGARGAGQRWLFPPATTPVGGALQQPLEGATGGHRQCFHYLFLLAAYFCGISIALNLGKQHSSHLLFTQPAIHFIERHLSRPNSWLLAAAASWQPSTTETGPLTLANYQLIFHVLIALKGLLLILQVTLQTLLIRSSCQRASSELRQIYTFLMFANLSLWALEICEQQQHLQRHSDSPTGEGLSSPPSQDLVTLDAFTRFAASIVTLSHLYHGLVFMQH